MVTENPPAIRKMINALNLTASIWHHDIIIKDIIISYYWITFRDLYEKLKGCETLLPGYDKKWRKRNCR